MTKSKSAYDTLIELIPMGIENAVSQTYLSDLTGYNKREIRLIINELRKYYPICSGNEGYWMGNNEDVNNTINILQAHIKTMQETVANLERILNIMED